MPDQPLNPDALEAAAKALRDDHANRTEYYVVPEWDDTPHGQKLVFRGKASAAVSAYLAHAQPVVTTLEELDNLPIWSYVKGFDGYKHVKEFNGRWNLILAGRPITHKSGDIELPAIVLYTPEGGTE